MASFLPSPLRNQLATVIKEARRVAEEGARKAVEAWQRPRQIRLLTGLSILKTGGTLCQPSNGQH